MYDYVEQNGQDRNSCAGCMILASVILLFLAACLSMCGDQKKSVKELQEEEIARFLEMKNDQINKRAVEVLTKDEFVCYAKRINNVLATAVNERRAALDSGKISIDKFKKHVSFIYDGGADKVFMECVNEKR